MSTDRQRLQAAIQRIAKQDPDLSALIESSKNKGGQASSSGIGVSDAERDNLCCDGTEGAGSNAGTDTRDPDDGTQDGLDSDDPANLGNGSLSGVTDCATGQPICFDQGGFIPPDGWDDPLVPPIVPGWDGGTFWYTATVNGSTVESASCEASKQAASDMREALGCGPREPHNCTTYSTGAWGCLVDGEVVDISVTMARWECDNDFNAEFCDPDNPPRLEDWGEDGCTNLAIYGGKIVGSKFDPENDGSYSAPRDELEVCDSSGNRILLRGSPTGGWKSIKSLSGDIDPDTGNGYLYRPNGQRVRQISPSEFRDDTV